MADTSSLPIPFTLWPHAPWRNYLPLGETSSLLEKLPSSWRSYLPPREATFFLEKLPSFSTCSFFSHSSLLILVQVEAGRSASCHISLAKDNKPICRTACLNPPCKIAFRAWRQNIFILCIQVLHKMRAGGLRSLGRELSLRLMRSIRGREPSLNHVLALSSQFARFPPVKYGPS